MIDTKGQTFVNVMVVEVKASAFARLVCSCVRSSLPTSMIDGLSFIVGGQPDRGVHILRFEYAQRSGVADSLALSLQLPSVVL